MAANGGAESAPTRSLVLTQDDRSIILTRLARAVLNFQDGYLSRPGTPCGLLCQVWLPEVVEDNEIVLKTKGLPFCVAGMGDLLALFRCISCRFAFGTNVQRANTLGAPGRVFTSSEPELCCNVQQYTKSAYLRKAEAEQCQVQSTLLLPLFISPRRSGCVGVLEVVQTSEDMAFVDVAALLAAALEKCELFTCAIDLVKRRAPAGAAATMLLLPAQTGVLVAAPAGHTSEEDSLGARGSGGDEAMVDAAVLAGAAGGSGPVSGVGDSGDNSDDDDDEDDDEDGSDGGRRRNGAGSRAATGGKPRRKGTGNPGKPGVRLTLSDLQSQFGVGLKEAASRLGICPTTLKRACRRHGIQRWPRRQLQKVNRALDELEARQMMQPQQHLAPQPAPGYEQQGGLPATDTRWTTLARFIPAYHSASLVGYNDQPLQLGAGGQGLPLPWSAVPDAQVAAAAAQQQQQLLAQQRAAAAQQLLGGRGGAGTPAASRGSLPDGALAMGGGGGGGGGGMQEVSTASGASSLGAPPPQVQPPRGAGVPTAQLQRRQSADSGAQPPRGSLLQHQRGPAPAGVHAAGAGYGHAPGPAGAFAMQQAIQQQAAFGMQGVGGAPVVRLPQQSAAMGATGPSISSLSVPSAPPDIMPPLPAGGTRLGGNPLADDDQVGFLDSSVLELLLSEDQRDGLGHPLLRAGLSAGGDGLGGGGGSDMLPPLPAASLPGVSAGLSGLSFMM